jgi:putative membrane protein
MFVDHGYYMGGMHAFWWLFWLILVVAFAYAVRSPERRSRRSTRESPLEILQRRFAQGEMSPEAYEQAKALLERDAGNERSDASSLRSGTS